MEIDILGQRGLPLGKQGLELEAVGAAIPEQLHHFDARRICSSYGLRKALVVGAFDIQRIGCAQPGGHQAQHQKESVDQTIHGLDLLECVGRVQSQCRPEA